MLSVREQFVKVGCLVGCSGSVSVGAAACWWCCVCGSGAVWVPRKVKEEIKSARESDGRVLVRCKCHIVLRKHASSAFR